MTGSKDPTPSGDSERYILLISIHGLIRGDDLELGRDADTGGQTKYVVELARALAQADPGTRVDLVTRRVVDDRVSGDYARPVEDIGERCRIVRIDCGPEEYIAKEQLWDHLDEFADNLYDYLHEQGLQPALIHSHYADAGYVGARLSNMFGVPMVYTGHSLGRDKRQRLLANGVSAETIESTYNIARRIDAEEFALENADLVVTSTRNEIEDQYDLYHFYRPERMQVIPPGTDLERFRPPAPDEEFPFRRKLEPFLKDPDKPMILALSRPDERKNILSLIQAYGESDRLQSLANLVIVAGNREDIRDLEDGAQSVLTNVLLFIDAYDLYGKVAIPKQHRADDIPQIYRMTTATRGVFINPALTEPFGLTLLEAAASGLPVVATENGGPVDIIGNCDNGILVDPLDTEAMADALEALLEDSASWDAASKSGIDGVKRHYSWQAHAASYYAAVEELIDSGRPVLETAKPVRIARHRDRALFTDIDNNLLGDSEALAELVHRLKTHHRRVVFGIATGRRIDSALQALRKAGVPAPDVLITSLGTRIHYGPNLIVDEHWADHIEQNWTPNRIRRTLADVPGLVPQSKKDQAPFKISYGLDVKLAPSIEEITKLLRQADVAANIQLSFGQYLDITPVRATKGMALRYVAHRLEIPLENILVAGGSGSDEDMMRGNTLAVVVQNRHAEELSELTDVSQVFFASKPFAAGILEAADHYDFFPE